MNITMTQLNINIQGMMRKQFDIAKCYMNLSILCNLLILVLNIIVTVTGRFEKFLALIVVLLVVLSFIFSWISDRLRDKAELMLRRFEMYDGLGWAIDAKEVSDLRASAPEQVKKAAKDLPISNIYFTSQAISGPQRLLKNLEESAWWTKQQAIRMSRWTGIFSVCVFAMALISLIIALQSGLNEHTADSIAKVIIALIVFIVSGGFIRQAFDYWQLSDAANQTEQQSIHLSKSNGTVEMAINLLHDYQIARMTAPLLPSGLWKLLQDELNELWEQRNS